MNQKKLGSLWKKYFEHDRVAERKVIKSIKLWNSGNEFSQIRAFFLYNSIRRNYGCSINPRIKIGSDFYLAHAIGVVIGQTSIIGNNCKIYPGAKLIAKLAGDEALVKDNQRRHPMIGDNCIIGADSLIIGPIEIGDNCLIASGAIVTKNIPSNTVVKGVNELLCKGVNGEG